MNHAHMRRDNGSATRPKQATAPPDTDGSLAAPQPASQAVPHRPTARQATASRLARSRAPRVPGQRPSAEQILTKVATLNLVTVAVGALLVAGALALAGRGPMAAGALAGSALVLATFAIDLFFVRHERFDGPVRVAGFLAKLVVFALGAWVAMRSESVDRAAIAWSVFAGLVASLVVSSWVVLSGEGPDFDMQERNDLRENATLGENTAPVEPGDPHPTLR